MSRPRGTLRRLKDVAYVLGWLLFGGCAPGKPAVAPEKLISAETCRQVIDRAMDTTHTCPEAELVINSNEVCHSLYPGGLHLKCGELQ